MVSYADPAAYAGMHAGNILNATKGGGVRARSNDGSGGFQSKEGTLGTWSTEAPDDFDWSGDEDGAWPVSRMRQAYLDYLGAKVQEYQEQQQSRHYYHGAQWTPEEIKVLRNRRQPIITFNRTSRKIDQIVGLLQRMRQDPKAYPRNPKNADGADIATECVRYACDSNDWEFLDPYCAGQAAIEGVGGLELKLIEGDHDDPDVGMDFIFGDDFFYDPRSYKPDFSDARYMGLAKWMDVEAAVELFPDKEELIRSLMVESGFDLTTHSDREYKWVYVNEKRVRLVEIWYRHKGRWMWAFFCSNVLLDQGVSPFLDERNKPMNRFVMFSAAVDHDGDRYGFCRNLKGPQDELNQRRSKALFMANVTRLISQKGAVDSVEVARREYARPDGFIEYNPGFPAPVPDNDNNDQQQQLALMQDARLEIDSFANITPDLITREVPGDHSGVAINMLQKAGIAELGSFLRNYKSWKKRVYRTVWNIIKRTWEKERYIRVSGDEEMAQFLQLNADEKDEWGQPIIVNAVGNIEVEMTLDDGPDEANLMQDAYDVLKNYPPGMIPPAVLIELSPMSSKVKKKIQGMMQQPQDPSAEALKGLAVENAKAEIGKTNAQAERFRTQSVVDQATAAMNAMKAGMTAIEAWMAGTQRAYEQSVPPQGKPQGGQGGPAGAPAPAPGPMASPGGTSPSQPPGAPPSNVMPMRPQLGQGQQGPQDNMMGQRDQQGRSVLPNGMPATNPAEAIMQRIRKAPDGKHYMPDPRRPGKYLMVA